MICKTLKCVVRMKKALQDAKNLDDSWIKEESDTIELIDLKKKKLFLQKVVHRIDLNCIHYINDYNYFLKNIFFPVNQTLSSKMSYFINHFKINEKVNLKSQYAFAVIELKTGERILIGPFKPKNVGQTGKYPDIHHSEHQCINNLKQEIKYMKKKKRIIKAIYIFTKYSPCLCIKGKLCPCMTQLANFSKDMYNEFNIDIYITFQDIYGATGSTAQTIKSFVKTSDKLSKNYEDSRNKILRLMKQVKKQYSRSKFTFFLGDKDQERFKNDIIKEMKEIKPDLEIELKIKFPSNPILLHEFKSFGEKQTNNIKTQLKNYNFTREIAENICSLFNSKWCEIADDKYNDFIYEKLSDYFKIFAVAFAYKDIKAFTNHFNLEKGTIICLNLE
ncbi:uncharacterized protein LOC109056064 [Cyprinus carpio]|uniref:Uncharacterized protein LOC109056064 n=1 Tax=Cyprinus carpio TaxID=7962 RepID=A0A9Q9XHI5_CYPCA|nr:uncharacterized protein LOC109056064 [Cyprinus carpio]